ncbi:hypothetical protein AA101099_0693 [Neoasaia chiangmaiensis NBRC 101099]|uniref:Uncharacterized protein n=1 Tax=Neoasaia chiangmaiensis TaxID=320497 RepID=A0A1U9KM28_9PROT|nr:hypothetical protein [Neoasaia chiangmaiensis]AQS86847.1 hypothetical protein A0U93_01535 [Neoasaia chiangmaiensis]GBR37374.1 hypothetical protein AA101099_0693 [Neoasaia chiangmaiensis NBRC 101099]GEN14921.1 hypothetical protein NCH01_13520 [Neoasaia chiangmaiensis]
MPFSYSRFVAIAAVTALSFAGTGAARAEDAMGTPVGHLTLLVKSADVGVGFTWGEGRLTYGHHTYKFKVNGADIAAVGYSKVEASAVVYNLKNLHDFDGTYGALSGEATLDKGLGGAVLSNSNGVRLKLQSVTRGARLAAGAQGLTLTLEQ